jgi:hypothetical protein
VLDEAHKNRNIEWLFILRHITLGNTQNCLNLNTGHY